MPPDTLESMIYAIKVDLMSVKTDVIWLKKLFIGSLIIIGATIGIDISGVM